MVASSSIPAVNAKNAMLANDTAVDVKKLDVEDAELVKTLAALPPGHPAANLLNARHGAIAAAKKNHE